MAWLYTAIMGKVPDAVKPDQTGMEQLTAPLQPQSERVLEPDSRPVQQERESGSDRSEDTGPRRRRIALIGLVAGAVGLSIGGLGASALVKSPQQLAAEADAPKPSVLTATVERRVLTETVVLRGMVVPGRTVEVTPAAAGEGKSVITRRTVSVGQRVMAGKVVAEVSGRPVILLKGAIPAYRDMRPGGKGPDVKQLQSALRGIGYPIADSVGVFGASTQAAVRRLYADRGYEPPVTESAEPVAEPGDGRGRPRGEPQKRASEPRRKVYLKAGEVVFVPRLPARVTEVKAGLGAVVTGTVMKLASGDLMVRGTLSPADRKLVKPGKPVKIFAEESGLTASGSITSIGAFNAGADGGSGSGGESPATETGHPILIKGDRPLSERLAGQDVRLTIEAASTEGPVLVVPSSAIYAAADGSTQVIAFENGRQRRVIVETGATGGGFVEIRSSELNEHDTVVVGK